MPYIILSVMSQNTLASDGATDSVPHVVSDAAHIFTLDPFGIDQVTRHATIESIIEQFGLPINIEIKDEIRLQFSKYVPVDYMFPGYKFTFGFESFWTHTPGNSEVNYNPYQVLGSVQGFVITSPDVKLRSEIHVGMKWDKVVEKLGKPYEDYTYLSSDSYTHRSNTIYYDLTKFRDSVTVKFEVNENRNVTRIAWPHTKSH